MKVVSSKHILHCIALAMFTFLALGNVKAQNRPVLTLQLGHSIRSMAVVPGDKFLVSAGDNTIKVWDLEERRLYRTILAHEDRVVSVSAHPVKAIVASGSYDNTVRIFNAVAGTEMKVLKGHTNAVMSVKYSPDGRYIASGGLDKRIIIWDGESGQQVKVIEGFRSGVISVAWSRDGKLLASGHNDELENLFISDVATGKLVRDLKKHQGRVFSVDFSTDGKTLAAGSQDLSISVWDIATANALPAMEGHKKIIYGVSYSPDGQFVASCGGDPNGGEVKIWPAVKAFEPILAFKGHSAQVSSVVFSGDSKTVFSGSFDNTIKAWDVSTGQELFTLQGLSEPVYDVQFNTEGSLLAVLNEGKIYVRSGLNGKTLYKLTAPEVSSNIIFGRTAGSVAAGNGDGSINIWEATGGRLYKKLMAGDAPVLSIAFSRTDKFIYAALANGTVQKVEVASGRAVGGLSGAGQITNLFMSADGNTLAGAGTDGKVYVWDPAAGTLKKTLSGHKKAVKTVAISTDGSRVASGSEDKCVILWDAAAGTAIKTMTGHTESVTTLRFSPDGKTLASACGNFGEYSDRDIRVWDVAAGTLKKSLKGHAARIYAVVFTPDGRYIASGSEDTQLKIWDVAAMAERVSLVSYRDGKNFVVYSSDGRFDGTEGAFEQLYYVQGLTFLPLQRFFERSYAPELWATQLGLNPARPILAAGVGKPDPIRPADPKPTDPKPADPKPTDPKPADPKPAEQLPPTQGPTTPIVVTPPPVPVPIDKPFALPPVVRITNPRDGQMYVEGEGKVNLSYEVKAQQGGNIDEVRIYQNGKLLGSGERGMRKNPEGKSEIRDFVRLQLVSGENTIKIMAMTTDKTESAPSAITVLYQAPKPEINLYVLSIGLNEYKAKSLSLNYARIDAQSVVKELEKSAAGDGKPYTNIVVKEIHDAMATPQNVTTAFQEIQAKARPQDVFLFFFAGHGVVIEPQNTAGGDQPEFYMVMYNMVNGADKAMAEATGMSAAKLRELCVNVPALSQIILLDACHSGEAGVAFSSGQNAVQQKALMNITRQGGLTLISASAADQTAVEFSDLGHGIFTWALLDGMQGKADGNGGKKDGTITINELRNYISEVVPDYTLKKVGTARTPVVHSVGRDIPVNSD